MNFTESILYTDIYKEIVPYLQCKDIVCLMTVNKYIYENKLHITKYLHKKSSYIIKLFKKYHTLNSFIQNEFNDITHKYYKMYRHFLDTPLVRKYQAMLYYSYYERKYRYMYYNEQVSWKKEIVDAYKTIDTNDPTKYDLFVLIKNMPIQMSSEIGW